MHDPLDDKNSIDISISTWQEPPFWQNWQTKSKPKARFMSFFSTGIYENETGYAYARISRGHLEIKWTSKYMKLSRAARLAELFASRMSRLYHLSDDDLLAAMLRHPRLNIDWDLDFNKTGKPCDTCHAQNGQLHSIAKTPYGEAHLVNVTLPDGKSGYNIWFLSEVRHDLNYREAKKFILDKIKAWQKADCCQVVGV